MDLKQQVRAFSTELPSRDVGSRGEELASETIADMLYDLGLRTNIDGFSCPGNLRLSRSVYFAIGLIAALICLFAPGIRIVAVILGVISLALLYMSYAKIDPLGSVLSKIESQNVVARYVPEGHSDSPRKGKVIITAYYDVQKPSLFQMPALRKIYPILRKVVIGAVVAIPVCSIIAMLPIPGIASLVFAIIAVVAGVVNLIAIIDQLLGTFLKTPKGANNNAAGLAVMCSLAEKIVTADVHSPSHEDDGRAEWAIGPDGSDLPDGETVASAYAGAGEGFAAAAEAAARKKEERDHAVEEAWSGVSSTDATAVPVDALEEVAEAVDEEPVETDGAASDEPESAESIDETPVAAEPAEDEGVIESKPVEERPARPVEPSPEIIAASRGSIADRFAYPAPAPRKKSSSKTPSWWQKVEDEKLNGEIGSGKDSGAGTMRSLYADAPANSEEPVEAEVQGEPAPAAETVVETPAEVAEVAPAEAAETVDAAPAEVAEPVEAAESVKTEEAASLEPAEESPAAFVENEAVAARIPALVVAEDEGMREDMPIAGELPEDPVDMPVDPDSTVAFTPIPIADAVVKEEPAGEPAEEPLLVPESGVDWPSGSYKFSRNRYAGSMPDEAAGQGGDYQPGISDYLRRNYMLDEESEPAVISSDATIAIDGESWLDAVNAESADAAADAEPGEEHLIEDGVADEEQEHAFRSGYQPPAIDRTASIPSSLLNLPTIGGLGGDITAERGAQAGFNPDSLGDDFSYGKSDEKNLTGSFAPVSASGVLEPITAEMLEQYNESGEDIHIADAVDSTFEDQQDDIGSFVAAREVEMPKKGRFLRRGGTRKKKRRDRNEMESASEWLGIGSDYNARNEGANIGSWDRFDDDENGWNGGAFGGSSPEENRDAIAALSDELLNKEVWFVALGASGAGSYGMRNLMKVYGGDLRHSRIINLEAIGAGELCFTASEPRILASKRTDPRLHKLVSKAGKSAQVKVDPISLPWRPTEATPAVLGGVRAISIIGVDGKTTPGWRWKDDIDDIVDEDNLRDVQKLLVEIIKGS